MHETIGGVVHLLLILIKLDLDLVVVDGLLAFHPRIISQAFSREEYLNLPVVDPSVQ